MVRRWYRAARHPAGEERAGGNCRAPGGLACRLPAAAILAAALLLAACDGAGAAPRVVATIKPLHSLVAGVMEGVGTPELLIRGAGSPHTYSLRPSEARLLERAEVIFWIGGPVETFLEKPLSALGGKARVAAAMSMPGVVLLRVRPADSHEEAAGGSEHAREPAAAHGAPGGHGDASWDGHLWLDPENARAIARSAAEVLGRADPPNRPRYAANAERLAARIDALDVEIRSRLDTVRDRPFVVFHDALQYFERAYGLRAAGSVVVSPERAPGARRVLEVRELILGLGARCVFSEPQFPPALVRTLVEGTGARTGTLDPVGADLLPGPEAWFELMRNLASSLREGLR